MTSRTTGLEDAPTELLPRRSSLRAELRARLVEALQRKRLDVDQVARRAGLHPRTIARLLRGETQSLATLEQVADALRIDLLGDGDCACTPTDADRRGKTPEVQGWRQAAQVLGIHRDTLAARRDEAGCRLTWPWWRDADACRKWFESLVGGG